MTKKKKLFFIFQFTVFIFIQGGGGGFQENFILVGEKNMNSTCTSKISHT